MQLQALVLHHPLMHPVKLALQLNQLLCASLVLVSCFSASLQMPSIGLLQGLVQYLTRLQHMHKCGWALRLHPPKVRCGLVQQWRLHMLICGLAQQWHLEQQELAQPPLVREVQGL